MAVKRPTLAMLDRIVSAGGRQEPVSNAKAVLSMVKKHFGSDFTRFLGMVGIGDPPVTPAPSREAPRNSMTPATQMAWNI